MSDTSSLSKMTARRRSAEMVCRTGGCRQDAPLHEPILDSAEAEAALLKLARARVRQRGLSRRQASKLFGLPTRAR